MSSLFSAALSMSRTLRRFRDDVREVASNFECGIGLAGYNDLVEGDIIECFTSQTRSRVIG